MANQFWTGMGNLATQAAQGAIGAGMGLLLQRGQDQRQLNMQRKLQRMEMEGTKEMTDYNYGKQLQLWKDTSYGAQKEQMMQAGLNPGLMYGMGGGGGQTAQIAQGNITGGQAPRGGGEATGMAMQMGAMQLQLLEAQKRNIDADTANKTATTPNIQKQGTGLDLDNEMKDIQNTIATLDKYKKSMLNNAEIAQGLQEVAASWEQLRILKNQAEISDKTKLTQIDQQVATLAATNATIAAQKQQIQLSRAQIEQIAEGIKQAWSQIDINATNAQTQQQLGEFTRGMGPQAASIAGDILQFILGMWKTPNRTTKGR